MYYIQCMKYFDTDDLDCVAYIEEKTNNVVIKFFGMPDSVSAELFANYAMVTLGIDYKPLGFEHSSKMMH